MITAIKLTKIINFQILLLATHLFGIVNRKKTSISLSGRDRLHLGLLKKMKSSKMEEKKQATIKLNFIILTLFKK